MQTTATIHADDNGEFVVIYPSGWTSQCKDRATAESRVAEFEAGQEPKEQAAPVAYAGGTRYHRPVKVLRGSDNLVKTACGQRGWISEDPSKLTACGRCF